MTARDYLRSQLSDPWPEATSVQTRTALCAYAIRMKNKAEGYSIEDAERVIREFVNRDDFVNSCTSFLSTACHYEDLKQRIPQLDD